MLTKSSGRSFSRLLTKKDRLNLSQLTTLLHPQQLTLRRLVKKMPNKSRKMQRKEREERMRLV